jgi:hypothetical protein
MAQPLPLMRPGQIERRARLHAPGPTTLFAALKCETATLIMSFI